MHFKLSTALLHVAEQRNAAWLKLDMYIWYIIIYMLIYIEEIQHCVSDIYTKLMCTSIFLN